MEKGLRTNMKKAILLTLLLSQPALALDMETRARDYTSWLNNDDIKIKKTIIGFSRIGK